MVRQGKEVYYCLSLYCTAYDRSNPTTPLNMDKYGGKLGGGGSDDFLESAQPRPPICLNCGEFAFFAHPGWLACLSFALAPIRLLPDYTVVYVTAAFVYQAT